MHGLLGQRLLHPERFRLYEKVTDSGMSACLFEYALGVKLCNQPRRLLDL